MRFYNQLTFKIMFLVFIIVLLCSSLIGWTSYSIAKKELINAGKLDLQHIVTGAKASVAQLDAQVQSGQLKMEEAKEQARVLLNGPLNKDGKGRDFSQSVFLYKSKGYIYGYNSNYITQIHPSLKIGSDQSTNKNSRGQFVIQEIVHLAKLPSPKERYYTYMWINTGETQEREKITYIDYYAPWDLVIGIGAYTDEFYSSLGDMRNKIIELSVGTMMLCMAFFFITVRKKMRMIKQIQQVTTSISEGNLGVEVIKVNSKDDIAQVALAINRMVQNLHHLIVNMHRASKQITVHSGDLSANFDQSVREINQINHSTSEVAGGADQQRTTTSESSRALEEMAAGIQKIAETTSEVSELTIETVSEASNGNKLIQDAVIQMEVIQQAVQGSSTIISELAFRSQKINNIINIITDISGQTNLLSLNAAIEAARAGEHGRGFAVVANEVRKLADQSSISANQISSIIKEIQEETELSIQSMKSVTEVVEQGTVFVQAAGKIFNHIVHYSRQVSDQMQGVSAAAQELSASSQEVSASLVDMTVITSQTAIHANHVASSSKKQLTSLYEISQSAENLSRMAQDLENEIGYFKMT